MFQDLEKTPDLARVEQDARELWDALGVYAFDPDSDRPTFSIDTPPPYVSAAHLHVGHAMSYTQAEIIARYKRMSGHNVYYPMGFDDNGLPTERYVEKVHGVDKRSISRGDFIELCIDETRKGAATYEELWRALGLSVDWSLSYSTISPRARRVAQASFIDLYERGLLRRANEPALWDPKMGTALAQADIETIERTADLNEILFASEGGRELRIATTRPELLPACVAVFCHPDDERYAELVGSTVPVPLSDRRVPVLASEDVAPEFGTGLMMVCTFGDAEDVHKWKVFGLETRIIIDEDGRMNELAGPYAGMATVNARARILEDLTEAGLFLGKQQITQHVAVGERSGTPAEFIMTPQWFIDLLHHKDAFLARAEELNWVPDWMKERLEHWVENLKFDWNISRQRFYGVPFPVWHVLETGEVILADRADLPVDPMEHEPPAWAREHYAGMTIVPETDVMDTWMTSSLTPMINSGWAQDPGMKHAPFPMDLRVQAYEIIRTWLFYSIVKAEYHEQSLPWHNVMISGWGVNEQGKKISKRDLEKYTDANGYNRYDPYSVIQTYGADALRYWAAGGQLGHNLRYNEKSIKEGRKFVLKLWNVARLVGMNTTDFDAERDAVAYEDRDLEDQWIISEMDHLIERMTNDLERYDFASAREHLHRFFWITFCDDYLEIVKPRVWQAPETDEAQRAARSAQATMRECLRNLLGLAAPFLPFVTEGLYQAAERFGEQEASIHRTPYPGVGRPRVFDRRDEMHALLDVLYAVRKARSEQRINQGSALARVQIDVDVASPAHLKLLQGIEPELLRVARSDELVLAACRIEPTGDERAVIAVTITERPRVDDA